jgi:putative sterol carrier protein
MIPPHLLERMNALLGELGYPPVGPGWEQALTFESAPPERRAQRPVATKVEDIFNLFLPALLKQRGAHLQGIDASYKFVVTGEDGGTWVLDLTSPGGQISAGDRQTTCVINVSSHDLLGMVNGEVNAAEALQQGKMRISGDVALVAQMAQVLLV